MTVHSLQTADTACRAAYRRQLRLRALPWSVGMLFVSWPIPLLTGLLLYRLGDLLSPWAAFAVPAGPVARIRLRHPAGADPSPDAIGPDARSGRPEIPRRPTAAEAETLDPAWRDTMRTIGLAEATFSVWVRDSPGPLGTAHPGGHVTVSAEVVRDFSSAELRGLLGHEVGHLVGDGGGTWYRLSWWYSGLIRMLFGTAAATLLAAALAQRAGQSAVLRRNQFNADRVSVDLGTGPGVRSYVVRRNRPARLRPRRSHRMWVRMVLWCLDAFSPDPRPDRRLEALDARMPGNRSVGPDPLGPGWGKRLGVAIFRPLRRLLDWSITTPTLNPFVDRRIPVAEPRSPQRGRRNRRRSQRR